MDMSLWRPMNSHDQKLYIDLTEVERFKYSNYFNRIICNLYN